MSKRQARTLGKLHWKVARQRSSFGLSAQFRAAEDTWRELVLVGLCNHLAGAEW